MAQGDWWSGAEFPGYGADQRFVSPDGQSVLVRRNGLQIVSLADGTSIPVNGASDYAAMSWSPDGRWILVGTSVFSSDGVFVADLPAYAESPDGSETLNGWQWSPDGQQLAGWINRGTEGTTEPPNALRFAAAANEEQGTAPLHDELRIFRYDGTELETITLPASHACYQHVAWRRDGTIYMSPGSEPDYLGYCYAQAEHDALALVVDPESDSVRTVTNLLTQRSTWSSAEVSWSPDGSKALRYDAMSAYGQDEVVREDGSHPVALWPDYSVDPSPWGSVATFAMGVEPGTPCNRETWTKSVLFTLNNLQNLFGNLAVSRLPANNGLVVRGTVADAHLDHYQLDYALQGATDTWYPIGPSSDVPVIDDVLTVWVPPAPGTYVLRLRVTDLAGNSRTRTRVVRWDRRASIANVTFDEALISPNDDGVKDEVTFRYLVLEPARVDVRIAGPGRPEIATTPTVRQFAFEHASYGPESFVWDGRDESGQVVPDGRYTVFINDLPFRVEVDATPPDIGLAYENLRAESEDGLVCPGDPDWPKRPVGVAAVDKRWHAVDAHLKGIASVYEFARDANGRVIYDNGVPRPERIDGRIVGRVDVLQPLTDLAFEPLIVEDYAGNRSTVTAAALPDQILLLEVRSNACDPAAGSGQAFVPPIDPTEVHVLKPNEVFLRYGLFTTRQGRAHLEYRALPKPGQTTPPGAWTSGPELDAATAGFTWNAVFSSLGILPGTRYESRFVLRSTGGEAVTQSYVFSLCDQYLNLTIGPAG